MDQKHRQNIAINDKRDFSPFYIFIPLMAFYRQYLLFFRMAFIQWHCRKLQRFFINIDHNLTSLDDACILIVPDWPEQSPQLFVVFILSARQMKMLLPITSCFTPPSFWFKNCGFFLNLRFKQKSPSL